LQLSYRFNESLNLSKEMRLLTKHLVSDSAILQVRPKSYHPGLLKVALDLAIEILLKNNLAKNLKKEEEFPKIEERTDEVYFEILAPRIYPLIQGQKSANQHYQE